MSSIGIMEGAYFVGRNELLNWLNTTFDLTMVKVEQVANGAVHCQIMDSIYPGKVPMKRVNFRARNEYEMIQNYKILQDVFSKLNIDRVVDVQKLTKGKYQDNLEFLQWMKAYYDRNSPGAEYEAHERRKKLGLSEPDWGCTGAPPPMKPTKPTTKPVARKPAERPGSASKPTTKPAASRTTGAAAAAKSAPAADSKEVASLRTQNQELNELVTELKVTVDALEKERDFYFGKLRDIEILCQTNEDQENEMLKQVLAILYATEEDFVPADQALAESEAKAADAPAAAEEPAQQVPEGTSPIDESPLFAPGEEVETF